MFLKRLLVLWCHRQDNTFTPKGHIFLQHFLKGTLSVKEENKSNYEEIADVLFY